MKSRTLNPVLLKELKLRFRNAKSFNAIVFYLIALTLFLLAYLVIMTGFSGNGYFRPTESFLLFSILTALQMGLVLFMAPALSAGAISTEREKQTLNILLTTTQSSTQIIIGKLLSSIAFLLLILISSLPVYSVIFLFGGISPMQLILVFLFYIFTVFCIGSVGLLFSTITKKTVVSMISTYAVTIFLSLFTFIFYIASFAGENGQSAFWSKFWLSLNPFAVVISILSPDLNTLSVNGEVWSLPLWVIYICVYAVIAVLCIYVAIKKLRPR